MGVDTTAYKVRAFVVSSFFAGVAGGAVRPLRAGHQPGQLHLREVDGGGGDDRRRRAGLDHRRGGGGGVADAAARGAAHALPAAGAGRRLARPAGRSDPHAHLRAAAGGASCSPGRRASSAPTRRGTCFEEEAGAPRAAAEAAARMRRGARAQVLLEVAKRLHSLRRPEGAHRVLPAILQQGDLKGLIGPNGAGKTTAFNVLTGVYAPTAGEVRVCGERVNGRRPYEINRLGLARTFQNIRLFKELTALDNVKVAILAETQAASSDGGAPLDRLRAGRSRRGLGGDVLSTRSTTTSTGGAPSSARRASWRRRRRITRARGRAARGDGPVAPGRRGGAQPALRRAAPAGDRPRARHRAPRCCCSTSRRRA